MRIRTLVMLGVMGFAAACATKPRTEPVNTGAGSVESARKFLQGRWTLESFEVFPPGKSPVVLKGQGTLMYDDYGNLEIEIRTDEKSGDLLRAAGIEVRDNTISSTGRTAIDVQNKTLSYMLGGQTMIASNAGPLAPSRLRHWEVDANSLTLTTKDESGKPLSIGRWRRMK